MKNLVLRADGNPEIGLGHLYRLKAIGDYFEDKTEVIFLSKDKVGAVIPENWTSLKLETNNEIQYIRTNFDSDSTVFVLDGYSFDSDYQSQLKQAGYGVVFIDDFHSFPMASDVVINPSISVKREDYSGNSRLGVGAHFSPLRTAFLEASKNVKTEPNSSFKKVFISLGGTDFHNISEKIIVKLNELKGIEDVHLLVGNSYANPLLEAAKFKFNLKIHQGLDSAEIIELIRHCDIAISSASTMSYELCSCRIPLIIGWYADNQQDLYQGLIGEGLAEGLGNILEIEQKALLTKLKSLFEDDFSNQIGQQEKMFTGFNKENIVSFILPLLSNLKIDNAHESDVKLYFDWANDTIVRANSLTPEPIVFENHAKWFSNKLEDNNSCLYKASLNHKPIGQVRFDLIGDYFEIDYSIDKAERGKGYGTEIIAIGISQLRKLGKMNKVRAKVKDSNKASAAVFQKLGFIQKDFIETEGMLIFDYHL